jgi:uncharacterized protein with WD repeat
MPNSKQKSVNSKHKRRQERLRAKNAELRAIGMLPKRQRTSALNNLSKGTV